MSQENKPDVMAFIEFWGSVDSEDEAKTTLKGIGLLSCRNLMYEKWKQFYQKQK